MLEKLTEPLLQENFLTYSIPASLSRDASCRLLFNFNMVLTQSIALGRTNIVTSFQSSLKAGIGCVTVNVPISRDFSMFDESFFYKSSEIFGETRLINDF